MRAIHLPTGADQAPTGYVSLLCDALRDVGVDARADVTLKGCRTEPGLDIVHLHWLEYVVEFDPTPGRGLLRSAVRAARLASTLLTLRRRGVGIVWTAHNLRPHEPNRPAGEALLTGFVLLVAHKVIVHSAYARRRLTRGLPDRGKVAVVPHGNYIGAFPAAAPHTARAEGRPFTFLSFGQIRPYKQLPELVRCFRALESPDVRLVIAGKPVVASELDAIRVVTEDDPRVVIDPRMVPDDEVAALHQGADAAIFSYREVFSSGALLLALSYGLPVVAPVKSSAPELVLAPGLESFAPGELASALRRMLDGDHQARRAAALRSAQEYPWSGVARETIEVYRAAIDRD